MALNFPGPESIEIVYTVANVQHKQELNCNLVDGYTIGGDPANMTLVTRDAQGVSVSQAVADYVDIAKGFFGTNMTFDFYNVWRYTPLSTERTFVTSGAIGVAGVSSNPTVLAQQNTLTFRTAEGGTMRMVYLEPANDVLVSSPLSAPSVNAAGFVRDYVLATDSWILARDTSYPIAPLNFIGGQNEAVFKRRYR